MVPALRRAWLQARRSSVLVGKFVVGVVVGLLYGILGSIAALGAGAGVLSLFGIDTALGAPDTWELVGRMLLAFALWALVGIGVGTVVRNQVAAIVIVLAVTLFVEPIVRVHSMRPPVHSFILARTIELTNSPAQKARIEAKTIRGTWPNTCS